MSQKLATLILASTLCCGSLFAGAVGVDFITTGTPGDYTLDFTVTNNLSDPGMNIYFFGVLLSTSNITGTPSGGWSTYGTWSNSGYGGSSLVYNNVWLGGNITDGGSQGGFDVTIPDAVAPSTVDFFAYGAGGAPYTGSGYFNNPSNPGFEGVAPTGGATAPEPFSFLLVGGGILGIVARRKRLA